MNKTGEISWNETVIGGEKRANNKDLFLKLSKGNNIVRLLTLPHQYYQHKYKPEGSKGYGDRITCTADAKTCPVCLLGDKPKRRWYFGVIDRKTNQYKILDVGYSVFKDINTYAQDEDWGNPIDYDFDVIVNPDGSPNDYYSCVAKPKKLLSASDLKIRDDADLEQVKRLSTAPTPEKVQERLNKVLENAGVGVSGTTQGNKNTTTASQKQVVDDSDDEDEFEFQEVVRKEASAPF